MMIGAIVGLMVAGLAAVPLSACLLTRGGWQIRRPRRALMVWALAGALGLVVTIVAVLVAAALSLSTSSAGAPIKGLALTLIAWAGLGGLGIAGSLAQLGRVDLGEDDGERPSITELLARRRTDSWQMGAITVVEIEDPRYVAVAIPGTPSTIFVSRAVRHALPPSYLSAVLAHEAAHLNQRHALLRRLGDWHTACLPKRSRLRREISSRITLLTELAADDAAASKVGPAHMRDALAALNHISPSRELGVRAARVSALHSQRCAPEALPSSRTLSRQLRPGHR
ncbi:hypothetical protein ACT3TZ_14830 [Brachybacterium sp. AOP25-B2-12]|uniref:hypothetical protein n=1 Tax=Brachybacterium sp. AOP25-B2-12 TaxID=3457710 RepID=UPI0040349BE6